MEDCSVCILGVRGARGGNEGEEKEVQRYRTKWATVEDVHFMAGDEVRRRKMRYAIARSIKDILSKKEKEEDATLSD